MLKIIGLSKKLTPKVFKINSNKVVGGIGSGKADKLVKNLPLTKKAKNESQIHVPNIGATREPKFLTFDAKKTFNQLGLAFDKPLVL